MVEPVSDRVRQAIRRIPDFPKRGIVFRDITTLWKDQALLKLTVDAIYQHYEAKRVDKVLGIEARGFVFGALLAERFGVGFIPARKLGKLPFDKITEQYQLEYRIDGLEMHRDSVRPGEHVLVVDDLMATAGTALAVVKMVEALGGTVAGIAFVVELSFLHGREKLSKYDVFSIVKYATEEE
ncbi:MAG: adenine phosphoribosyltransferase [Nitrososphaerota archaeon]|nr:adenine phosphoribosyltransferase [Nitrososphaerota archaeon]